MRIFLKVKKYAKYNKKKLVIVSVVLGIVGAITLYFTFAYTNEEDVLWAKINTYRAQNGLPAFQRASCPSTAAHAWSKNMSDTIDFRHGGGEFLADLCPSVATGIGENIGIGPDVVSIFTNWTISKEGHKELLLSSMKYAGVGVVTSIDGDVYATLLVMNCSSGCLKTAPTPPYPTSAHISPANNTTIQPCLNGTLITRVETTFESTGSGNISSRVNYKDDDTSAWSSTAWSSFVSSGTDIRRNIAVTVNNSSGTTFTWQVVGQTNVGYTGSSGARTFKVAADTPPTVPGEFNPISQNKNSITLGWSSSTDNCKMTGYELYRMEHAGINTDTTSSVLVPKIKIASPSATATSYTDYGVKNAGYYSYELCALDNFTTPQKTCDSVSVTKLP